jgi:ribonuclease E
VTQVAEVAEVPAPKKSRRRSSRSAKSPAFSVDPTAAPMTETPVAAESAAQRTSFQPAVAAAEPASDAPATDGAQAPEVAEVTAPVARARHKRPRVVAPAGPPRAAGDPEATSGEFGS